VSTPDIGLFKVKTSVVCSLGRIFTVDGHHTGNCKVGTIGLAVRSYYTSCKFVTLFGECVLIVFSYWVHVFWHLYNAGKVSFDYSSMELLP
jgi:hypothetical protein